MNIISVIVPIYYGERYIADVIRQMENCMVYLEGKDYVEVLFVNDSPDAPLSMNWDSDLINIRIINSTYHTGIHGARVRGFKQSIGDYVLLLDQDDKIIPEYFHSQLQKLGESDAVVCKALNGENEFYVDDANFFNIPSKQFVLRKWNLIISPGQVLIKRKSIPSIWTETIMENNFADDWFLWICMYANNCMFALNEEVLYKHTLHGSNTSDDMMTMLYSEQEIIDIVYRKKILSDYDFGLLLEGFYNKNYARTQQLYYAKEKVDCLDKLIKMKEHNIKFSDYLFRLNIQKIAIYGCGILGNYIFHELRTEIEISCFIDRNASRIKKEIPVYTLKDSFPEADAVIITLMGDTEKIEKNLKEKGFKNVIILKKWVENSKRICR